MPPDALDRPVWHALTGAQADWAQNAGPVGSPLAARFHPEVGPFAAVADVGDPAGWAALAGLAGPGGSLITMIVPSVTGGLESWAPAGWSVTHEVPGVQMVGDAMQTGADPDAVRLGVADAVEMVDLVARTRPGPFGPRTVELGGYLGIRVGGRLVAMAGRRFRPGGWTEISAVCTDADFRGKGLGARLVRAVGADIVAAGESPFLHTGAGNASAIRLYEALGMRILREVRFLRLTAPEP